MPSPPTATLKTDAAVLQEVLKLAYGTCRSDVQESAIYKFVSLVAELMSSAALLKTAINKLEGYGSDAAARISKDKGGALLSVIAKTITRFNDQTSSLETLKTCGWESWVASTKFDASSRRALMNLDPCSSTSSFIALVHHACFEDCICTHITQECVKICQMKDKLLTLCQGKQAGGDQCWSLDLDPTCNLAKVAATAKSKWRSLDVEAIDTQWNAFAEARAMTFFTNSRLLLLLVLLRLLKLS